MKELLNKQSQRIVYILEMLVFSDKWLTQGQIALKLETSERTIAEDIALIKRQYTDLLDMQFSNKLGVRVRNRNVAVLGDILSDVYRSSFILQWIELVFLFPNNSTLFYAKRLNVSESTLYKLYPSLRKKLKADGISFKRLYGNYSLDSKNESYIRTFFTTFFIEMYGLNVLLDNHHFHAIRLYNSKIIDMLDKQLFSKEPEIEMIHRQFHIMFFFVSFFRSNQGYTLFENISTSYKDQYQYELIKSIYPQIHDAQIDQIFHLYLQRIRRPSLNAVQSDLRFKEVYDFIEAFLISINVDYSETMIIDFVCIFYEVINIYGLLPSRTSSMYSRCDYFCAVFKQYHYSVYEKLESALHRFSQDVSLYYPSVIESIIFWMCIEYPNFYMKVREYSILVVSDLGLKHAEFICQLMNLYYNNPNLVNVALEPCYVADSSSLINTKDYDFIVSTTHDVDAKDKPLFCVSDHPNDDILFQIYKHMIKDSEIEST